MGLADRLQPSTRRRTGFKPKIKTMRVLVIAGTRFIGLAQRAKIWRSGAGRASPHSLPDGRSADLRTGTQAGSETRDQLQAGPYPGGSAILRVCRVSHLRRPARLSCFLGLRFRLVVIRELPGFGHDARANQGQSRIFGRPFPGSEQDICKFTGFLRCDDLASRIGHLRGRARPRGCFRGCGRKLGCVFPH